MSENAAELLIELSLEGSDSTELDELTRELRAEVEQLNVDSVEQAKHCLDLLADHQRLEIVDGEVLPQAEVDVSAFDDVPGLGFAVPPAEVLCRERGMRMSMHRKALTGVEQLHEEARVGAEALDMRMSQPGSRILVDRGLQGSTVGKGAEAK